MQIRKKGQKIIEYYQLHSRILKNTLVLVVQAGVNEQYENSLINAMCRLNGAEAHESKHIAGCML